MNKPLKYGLLGLGGLVLLLIAAVAVFALTFNPNRYKDEVERLAKEKTGRTLKLGGEIKMAFWPSLGAGVAKVTFSEKGSNQEFVSFDSAHASVKLMPLLHGQYIVDAIKLSGLKAHIVKGKDGRFNFSDLTEPADKKPAAEARKAPEEKSSPVVFDVGSVDIERSSIVYTDLQAGQEYALEDVKLKTGRIAQDAEGKLDFATHAKRKTPPLEAKLALDGTYRLVRGTLSADVTAKLDDSTIKTKFILGEPIEFDAAIDKINLDRYLGAQEKQASAPAAKPAPKSESDTPVDLSALKGINAKGRLQIGALEVRGLKLADLNAQLNAANGHVAVAPHSAKGYDGTISGGLVVDANKNSVALKENLAGVSVGPILRDFANQDRLEGKGDIGVDVTTAGATVNAMKGALAGTAKVQLRDGAVKGINLAETVRRAKSMFSGGGSGAAQGGSAADKTQKTDFSELSASFAIKGGVAHNEDLDVKSPLFRIGGAGNIDIGNSRLDYVTKASVVATTKGQGGDDLEKLRGLTVPVHLTGPFDDLKYNVDYRAVAGQAAKSEVGQKLKERLKDQKLQDKLKGLLGR